MDRLKIFLVVSVAFALAGCGPCAKRPQPPPQTPVEEIMTEAVQGWQVGQWCTYRLTSAGGKKADVTVSLTGTENAPGGDYYWLEVVVKRDDVKAVTKALVPQLERVSFLTSGKDLTKESKRLIVKMGDEQAVELPLKELQLFEKVAEKTGKGADLNEVFGGGADVSSREAGNVEYAAAGGKKLQCRKLILSKAGRDVGYALGSDQVPIFGIAFSEHEKGKLELVDCGESGATTAITEEPLKFDIGSLATGLKDIKIK